MTRPSFDLARVREAIAARRIQWTEHAVLRMQERGIARVAVLDTPTSSSRTGRPEGQA